MSIPESNQKKEKWLTSVDLLLIALQHRVFLVSITAVTVLVSTAVALYLPNSYSAKVVLLPPQENQSSASALLGGLASSVGLLTSAGIKNPNDLYIAMLKSNTVKDRIVKKFKLMQHYDADSDKEARKELSELTSVVSEKDGLVSVEVMDHDPKLSALIAEAYVEELDHLTEAVSLGEAAQRRSFYERELLKAKNSLEVAEAGLKKLQQATGVVSIDIQSKTIIEAVAAIKAQVTAKELQLSSMGAFATERNPDYLFVQRELAALKAQLEKYEQDHPIEQGELFIPTGRLPDVGMRYAEKMRDVKYREVVYELIVKQFELAKLDEGRNATLIQILDHAEIPEKKTKPKRLLIVLLSVCSAFSLAFLLLLIREAILRWKRNPEHLLQVQRFKDAYQGK